MYKSTIKLAATLAFIFCLDLHSQNLVFNPGLETTTANPTGYNQLNEASGWSNCNGNYNTQGTWGSPDLLSLNGSGVAQLPCGYIPCVQPHSGNNVVGFISYNGYHTDGREYVSTNLTTSLQIGQTYSVSFWATIGYSTLAKYVTNNIGALFTVNAFWHGSYSALVNRTPHYNMSTPLDSTGWKYYSFTFVADSAYNYITFGNYHDDASTTITSINNSSNQVYSYNVLDDFSVSLINPMVVPQSSFATSASSLCVGKSIAAFDLSSHSPTSWNWQVTGPVSATSTQSNPIFNFSVAGAYSISLISSNSGGQGTIFTKTILVYANPTISAIASPSIVCKDAHTILSASGAQTYSWSSGQTGSLITTAYLPITGSYTYAVYGVDQNSCTDSTHVSFKVTLCETTSLLEYRKNTSSLEIFPNPNSGLFVIKATSEQQINILNEYSQLIKTIYLTAENNYRIEITDLTPGIYFAKNRNSVRKILIYK